MLIKVKKRLSKQKGRVFQRKREPKGGFEIGG